MVRRSAALAVCAALMLTLAFAVGIVVWNAYRASPIESAQREVVLLDPAHLVAARRRKHLALSGTPPPIVHYVLGDDSVELSDSEMSVLVSGGGWEGYLDVMWTRWDRASFCRASEYEASAPSTVENAHELAMVVPLVLVGGICCDPGYAIPAGYRGKLEAAVRAAGGVPKIYLFRDRTGGVDRRFLASAYSLALWQPFVRKFLDGNAAGLSPIDILEKHSSDVVIL